MKNSSLALCLISASIVGTILFSCNTTAPTETAKAPAVAADTLWHAPDTATLANNPNAELIRYGGQLVANTSQYLGPKGTVAHSTNGMNCQNCHLAAGTKPFGNNYSAVAATYPKFRARSGTVENISKRINDCIQRSLNGTAIDTESKEMKALSAYILWVGKDVPKGKAPAGSGLKELAFPGHAADTANGRTVYVQKCQLCHGGHGEGMAAADGMGYQYPPLWGGHSYNSGAGIMRLSKLAGYAKYNMPFGTSFPNSQLSDEEAWDVAAFINSQPRPHFDIKADWPDISKKPIDHPFGPYADGFTEAQHKYGPFKPIADARKAASK